MLWFSFYLCCNEIAIRAHFSGGNGPRGLSCFIELRTGPALNYMHDSELLSDRIHQRLIQKYQNTASGIFHVRPFHCNLHCIIQWKYWRQKINGHVNKGNSPHISQGGSRLLQDTEGTTDSAWWIAKDRPFTGIHSPNGGSLRWRNHPTKPLHYVLQYSKTYHIHHRFPRFR